MVFETLENDNHVFSEESGMLSLLFSPEQLDTVLKDTNTAPRPDGFHVIL
jgi:hypothetical protein